MADTRNIPVVRYNQTPDQAGGIKAQWWNAKENEMHAHAMGVAKQIRQQQAYRSQANLRFAQLYANMEIAGLQAGMFGRIANLDAFFQRRLSLNVIASCIDTAASKIGKNRTRPLFMTEGGDWTLQRRAQKLTRFMEGAFDSMGTGVGDNRTLYGIGRRAFVDSCVLGTGAVKFYADQASKSVKAERVLIEEIVVDEVEGMYEDPRQLHQEKMVHREVLADMVESKFRDKVMAAASGLDGAASSQNAADMLKVVESWHLPSSPDASDGRKAISVDGCTLNVDDWKRDYFPFLFKRWKPRILGFYGSGLAEELVGIQLEINKLLRTIAIAQHLACVPQVWLELSNRVNVKQVDNEIGGVKFYTGQPPIFTTGSAMPPEVYSHLETLYRKAFEITGLSLLSATSQKPGGLDSRVALREFQDIESERFQLVGLRDQDFYIDAAYMTMDLMEDLQGARVRVVHKNEVENIPWKDVRIDRDKLRIRAFPTDILPSQPPAKLEKVQEMLQAGFFDKDESMELLDYPDLENVVSLKVSSRRNIRRMLEKILDTLDYEPPEPYMNLQLARFLGQAYYERGKCENMPEERLDLLRRFMDDVQALIDKAKAKEEGPPAGGDPSLEAAAAAEAAQGGAGAPIAQPQPAPVSELLPVGQ